MRPAAVALILILAASVQTAWGQAALSAPRGDGGGRWVTSKGLTISADFSDNIGLDPVDPESDVLLRARPTIGLSRRGGRVRTSFIYGPELGVYLNDTYGSRVTHYLRAQADAELVRRIFFLRLSAGAEPRVRDPRRRAGFDTVANPDATSQTFYFRITPDIQFPLQGDFAEVRIRPGLNFGYASDSADDGGSISRGGSTTDINIKSGPRFTRFLWSLDYRNDVFDADTQDSWGRASATMGYRFTPRYTARMTFGYDSARVDQGFASDGDSDGFRWRATLDWTPTPRTSLSLGIGEAFFGDDWQLRLRHRHKRTAVAATYYRNIENFTTSLIEDPLISFEDSFGNETLDPITGQDLGVEAGTPALVEDVYLNERFRVSVDHVRGRTSAGVSLNYSKRDYGEVRQDDEDLSATIRLSRALAPRTRANLSLRYLDHREEQVDGLEYDQYAARLGLSYQLGPQTSVSMSYQYTERRSDNELDSYDENRLSLSLGIRL